jgi:hypothetical protein
VYQTWNTRDLSLSEIARELCAKGITSAKGSTRWTHESVADLLHNPAYCGDVCCGHGRGWHRKRAFNKAQKKTKRNACPAIVTRDVWKAAQDKLTRFASQGKHRRRVQARKAGVLSGVVYCGHCGHTMQKAVFNGRASYVCRSPVLRPDLGCRQWTAREEHLLPVIRKELVEAIDWEVLQALQAKQPKDTADPRRLEQLQRQESELARKVAKAQENILLADADDFPALNATLKSWKDELTKIRNTLELATADTSDEQRMTWVQWWQQARPKLVPVPGPETPFESGKMRLSSELHEHVITIPRDHRKQVTWQSMVYAEPDVIRELLHRLNARLFLHWKKAPGSDYFHTLDFAKLRAEIDTSYSIADRNTRRRTSCCPARTRSRAGASATTPFSGIRWCASGYAKRS